MEGILMAGIDFAPLILPVSSVTEGLESSYKVIATNRQAVTVEASCAAEAIEKSGVARPLRVVSIAQEQRRMMQRNLLHPQDRTVATDIDTEHYVPDFRSLVVDNLEEEEKLPFEECSLASMAVRRMDQLPEKPKPLPKPKPAPPKASTPPSDDHSLIAVEKTPPAEPEIIPPDRELTPDEVEALMNAKELPAGE